MEAVDVVIDHWPQHCGCGHAFAEAEREPAGEPARHQVCELPEIAVKITEHRLHRLSCPDCGQSARAGLPFEVPAGSFGPRLEAAIATLAIRNRVSRRDSVELVGELFGAELSPLGSAGCGPGPRVPRQPAQSLAAPGAWRAARP
jgi:transposase